MVNTKKKQKFIYLYSDEFDIDVWESYCDILGVPYNSTEIKITVADVDVISMNDEDLEDDEDDNEDEGDDDNE